MNQRRERGYSLALCSIIHKLPRGDSPYVRAKHALLVDKDKEGAIALYMKAIQEGDRVDSSLKDMALLMKQQNRAEEAIEVVKTFRIQCSKQAQGSLDNVLIDLYKKCGRMEEHIELLGQKLQNICRGEGFNGKPTKRARSHGKKFQITVEKEICGILGNMGWAYMQLKKYTEAEMAYRKALLMESDANKACNLCNCLIRQGKHDEARNILFHVILKNLSGFEDNKLKTRVGEMLREVESPLELALASAVMDSEAGLEDVMVEPRPQLVKERKRPYVRSRLPIFEEILPLKDQMAC